MVDTARLKKLRCNQGYFTAVEFAKALGMKSHNYRNRENGHVPFSAAEIVQICELLEIPLEEGIRVMC